MISSRPLNRSVQRSRWLGGAGGSGGFGFVRDDFPPHKQWNPPLKQHLFVPENKSLVVLFIGFWIPNHELTRILYYKDPWPLIKQNNKPRDKEGIEGWHKADFVDASKHIVRKKNGSHALPRWRVSDLDFSLAWLSRRLVCGVVVWGVCLNHQDLGKKVLLQMMTHLSWPTVFTSPKSENPKKCPCPVTYLYTYIFVVLDKYIYMYMHK